jgi:hypothetical protein
MAISDEQGCGLIRHFVKLHGQLSGLTVRGEFVGFTTHFLVLGAHGQGIPD